MSKTEEKPQIKLPFSTQKVDAGEWAYDHRLGLMFTFIVAVIFVLLTLYVTITVQNTTYYDAILIDMQEQIEQIEQLEEQVKTQEQIQYEKVSNLSSNENANELNDGLTDAKNTPAKEIYQEIEAMQQKAQQNRDLYEQGLAEQAALIQNAKSSEMEQSEIKNIKVDGMVTVSFSFVNPIRKSVNLTVPAYMCEGGGMVVVDALLDNSGKVIESKLNKRTTTQDNCMIQTAINAAKSSRFDLNVDAPTRQSGTITYIFIPQ